MDLKEINISTKRHPWELARISIVKKLLDYYCPLRRKNLKVLDVGCGDAFTVHHVLDERPCSVIHGYDEHLTEEDLEMLSCKYKNIKFFSRHEDLEKNTYDIILILDVLEHVKNDQCFLNDIVSQNLKADGIVLLTAPAFHSLFSNYDRFFRHYRRYDRKRVSWLIGNANLKQISSGYFFSSLLIPRAISCCAERIFPRNNKYYGLGGWKHGSFLSNCIKKSLEVENRILFELSKVGLSIPGLTLWSICRKKDHLS